MDNSARKQINHWHEQANTRSEYLEASRAEVAKLKKFIVIIISNCDCAVEKRLAQKQQQRINKIFSEVGDIIAKEKAKKKAKRKQEP